MPTSSLSFVLEMLYYAIKQEKEIRDMRIGKEEIEPLSFAEYRKHEFIGILVKIIKEFSKKAVLFLTIQRPIVCLKASNKYPEYIIE